MNEDDIDKLNYFLSIPKEDFVAWCDGADLPDLCAMNDLLQQFLLDSIDHVVDKHDLSDAKTYLKKFTK